MSDTFGNLDSSMTRLIQEEIDYRTDGSVLYLNKSNDIPVLWLLIYHGLYGIACYIQLSFFYNKLNTNLILFKLHGWYGTIAYKCVVYQFVTLLTITLGVDMLLRG